MWGAYSYEFGHLPSDSVIGEMRDSETAAIGIEASLTGHLSIPTRAYQYISLFPPENESLPRVRLMLHSAQGSSHIYFKSFTLSS